jgi:CHAD domain-containing protein
MVALARIDAAKRGYEQMLAGHSEGLHDLRVSVRRLRTLLRAFRPLVDNSVRKKTLRALRSIARATGKARDAEVAAEWISAQSDVPPRARSGVRDAVHRLEEEREAGLKSVRARLEREFPALVARLSKQLFIATDAQPGAQSATAELFGAAAEAAVIQQKARLTRALERVKSAADVDEAHRARIAAKRLRYVLEPLHEHASDYAPLARVIELQDLLGTARDAHQLARRFVREIGEMAARDARVRALVAIGVKRKATARTPFTRVKPGLVELARRAHVDERRAFAAFRRVWGKHRAAAILETIV